MYRDLRIRNSNRPTPIPPTYKSYTFMWRGIGCGDTVYKTIIAPSRIVAMQRIKDFSYENDLDAFWTLLCEDDFEVAYTNDLMPR